MKLKHRSIRFKFFAAISIIALVFIGILVLLNVFFLSGLLYDDTPKRAARCLRQHLHQLRE